MEKREGKLHLIFVRLRRTNRRKRISFEESEEVWAYRIPSLVCVKTSDNLKSIMVDEMAWYKI